VDERMYAHAADGDPFTQADDDEHAAVAALVLLLWQRPDTDGEATRRRHRHWKVLKETLLSQKTAGSVSGAKRSIRTRGGVAHSHPRALTGRPL
jgi:hypothetical protein